MKKIAVIISQIEESCQSLIWQGIYDSARDNGVDVVVFPALSGSNIISHYPFIADFVNTGSFSRVILFSGAMAEYTNWAVVEKYLELLDPPVISIAGILPRAHTSIMVDNKKGIIEQITHLKTEHNKSRIGFVKGPATNEDALERLDAYISGLKQCGLGYDSSIIFDGTFSGESGKQAARRIIRNSLDVDALVCADDEIAMGAIKEFHAHGVYVPNDIAVTGFDDIPEANMFSPSLTTVRQPFYEIGAAAVEAALIPRESKTIIKPAIYVPRSSCGCINHSITSFRKKLSRIDITQAVDGESTTQILEPLMQESITGMRHKSPDNIRHFTDFVNTSVQKIFSLFQQAVDTNTPEDEEEYIKKLSRTIEYNLIFEKKLDIWQYLISFILPIAALRKYSDKIFIINKLQLESMLIINQSQRSHDKYRIYLQKNQKENLRQIYQNIISQHNAESLLDYVIQQLKRLGSANATIVLFYNYASIPYLDWNLPDVSHIKRQIIQKKIISLPEEGIIVNNREILSSHYAPMAEEAVFLPLYFYGEYFGYIIMDVIADANVNIYEDLRAHTSTALHNCYMKERYNALSMQDELTDVSNKNGFMLLSQQTISQCISTKSPVAVFFVNITGISEINTRFGHDEGDRAIIATASLLKRTFRDRDIVGRIGADIFAVTIKAQDLDIVEDLFQRIFTNLALYNEHSKHPYDVNLQVGYFFEKPTTETNIERAFLQAKQRSKPNDASKTDHS
jgi:diguanylate cyclase (GGDEF)-like protein